MKNNREPLIESSRSKQRSKRRKTNVILNSLIVIVLLLIVIVSVNIFGKDDKKKAENNTEQTVASTVNEDDSKKEATSDNRDEVESSTKEAVKGKEDSTSQEKSAKKDKKEEEPIEDEQVVTDGESNPNAIKDPAWQPVDSSQVEPAQDYNKGSVDWNEQIQAVSMATGFNEGNGDILYMLENNGPKKSAATVLIKETNQKYRVYIEWVDGEGWKPALVEKMN